MKLKVNWDGLGIATSMACAIHCALLPLLLTSLPILGMNIIHNTTFEWVMICLALAIGTYALYHGYMKHHSSALPLVLFITGGIFLVTKQLVPEELTLLFLFMAVVLIISAHYYNYRLCHRSKCSSPHHKH